MESVPHIDCSSLRGQLHEIQDTTEFSKFSDTFGQAMHDIGFVYLVNHGVDEETVNRILGKLMEFYKLPNETKLKYRTLEPLKSFFGYKRPEDEAANEGNLAEKGELKESFDFCGPEVTSDSSYPAEVAGLREAVEKFRELIALLSQKLLRALALYMKLDDLDYFVKRHAALENPQIVALNAVRSNYYMAMESGFQVGPDMLRMHRHKDWGTLTFLIQDDAGGLETQIPSLRWLPVTPIKGSIVLNAGLMLELWSGGLFPAAPHRVRLLPESAGKERQSCGFFLQPDGHVNCTSIVPEQKGWNPGYPKMRLDQTQLEYFKDRVQNTRLGKSALIKDEQKTNHS